jgi:hypothetical protein
MKAQATGRGADLSVFLSYSMQMFKHRSISKSRNQPNPIYGTINRLNRIDATLIIEQQTASLAIYKCTYVLAESRTRAIHVIVHAIS